MNGNRMVTVAALGTPCGWWTYSSETGHKHTCGSGKPAVHVLTETLPVAKAGTALCGLHSPYDVTEADRAALTRSAEDSTEPLMAGTTTLCGTFAIDETVTHPDHGQGTVVDVGSAGGMLVAFPGGASLGVDEAHFGEWTPVRTDEPGSVPSDVEMAEAERDERIFAAERAAILGADNDDSASTNERDGIEILRELLTLPPVRTRKAAKVVVMHLNDAGINTWACGTRVGAAQGTNMVSQVTCKRCPKTVRFQRFVNRATLAAKHAEYKRAGLSTGLVVRQITTGRLGVVTCLDMVIRVSYWTGMTTGNTYATVAEFDQACQIVTVDDFVSVGSVLVSNIGDEVTVTYVGSTGVTFNRADGTTGSYIASGLAAEISRGQVAVVPTKVNRQVVGDVEHINGHKYGLKSGLPIFRR